MILVTGASGTVGSEVVKALGGTGAKVRAGYRTRAQNIPKGVESVALDFDAPETVAAALMGVETVFLLSSMVAPETKVVDEAKRAGVKRVVKLSVFAAAEEGFTFARWHRGVEKHIEGSGLAWTFLRPSGFMQNFFNYMGETIRKQSAFYTSAGNGASAHIDARDIGAAAAKVLTGNGHDGKAYDLTGPEALTYPQAAAILSRALGREIQCVPITPEQYKQGALAAGMPEVYVDALVDLDRYYSAGRMAAPTPTVKQLTGREPIRFEQFAKDYADRFKA
jgi:uncharacterized protein YbjT (DUF2867 family)